MGAADEEKVCQQSTCFDGVGETKVIDMFGPPVGPAIFSSPFPSLWLMSTGHFPDIFAKPEVRNYPQKQSLSTLSSDPANQILVHARNEQRALYKPAL